MSTNGAAPAGGNTLGRSTGSLAGGVAKLPLVSLVIVNWNYADYLGEAIDSLKAQDYPELEIVVVDNGSTDLSRDVIAAHIDGDRRCRVIHLEENLGQLGAFFEVLPLLSGDFVAIIDADDTLCPHFVSTHIQVHLALTHNVALTSSNIVEMDKMGRALTGQYEPFNRVFRPSSMGLRRIDKAMRLPTISDRGYHDLARSVFVYESGGGWMWGPGSSNVYRRSVLDLAHYSTPDRTWIRGADNFLNPLCHVFGGSALIDQPLSAYRLHGANYFSQRETLAGWQMGKPDTARKSLEEGSETLSVFLEKSAIYRPILEHRFWLAFDQLSAGLRGPTGYLLSTPTVLTVLSDHYQTLTQVFGEIEVHNELGARLTPQDLYGVLRRGQGGRLPSIALLRHEASPARHNAERAVRVLRRYGDTPIRRAPRIVARDVRNNLFRTRQVPPPPPPAAPATTTSTDTATIAYADRLGYGPGSLLSVDPPIFFSGMAFKEHVGIAGAFGRRYGNIPAAFVLYPTWTIANEGAAASVVAAAHAHLAKYPNHHLVFMCNTGEERDRLVGGGLSALLLNKNFIVSERTFRPLDDVEVEFDAIYNARFDESKRHHLASEIQLLAYLSYDDPANTAQTRREQRELLTSLIVQHPNHVLINPTDDGLPVRLPPDEVNAALNRAAVGLCLSQVEGANYASMEYLLAGLPVVSTPSIGGRDVYFDHEYCTICDPDPAAVRRAVESLRSRHIPRDYIRERTLAKIEPERQRFLSLIDDLRERLGGQRCQGDGVWPFATMGQLVTWDEHWKHLAEFERVRHPSSERAPEPDATIRELLAQTDDVQLQIEELRPIVGAIQSRPACSLLVFGCGNDSVFWERINEGGTTVFLEDDPVWADEVRSRLDRADVHRVEYGTRLAEWESLLHAPDLLELDLPEGVASQQFDVIVVDAPAGDARHSELTGRHAPGRMKSIYMASKLVAPGGFVFVHDCDRHVEQLYATEYLGVERLFIRAEGRALLQGYEF
ncbi:MAG: glycosyltransferase [Acidimicrobiales bacterium]